MSDLVQLTRDALAHGMSGAGWMSCTWASGDVYDRPATPPFVLRAELWFDDAPVAVEASVSVLCDAVDEALDGLVDEEVEAWISRDPLGGRVTIEGSEQVEPVVADVVRRIGTAADGLLGATTVDGYIEAVSRDEASRDNAPVVVPVALAVAGRTSEARARARAAPGDFAERFERWLAGEELPTPGYDEAAARREAAATAMRKMAEHRAASAPREQRPQASWSDVFRVGRRLARVLKGDMPPGAVMPKGGGSWQPVELEASAEGVLQRACEVSSLPLLQGAFVEARLEPAAGGRLRVFVDGSEVGTVAGGEDVGAATVSGKVERTARGATLSLAVQLPITP